MDLVRSLLLELEARVDPADVSVPELEGRSDQEVAYHLGLMKQAGLIYALGSAGEDAYGTRWLPQSLTWEGHEFLDAAREDERWQAAKRIAKENGGALTFEAIKTALSEMTKRALLFAISASG